MSLFLRRNIEPHPESKPKHPMTTKTAVSTAIQPYLFFNGRCEEALEFYRRHLGAEIGDLMRFKDSPDQQSCGSGGPDKIMHVSFRVGDTQIMASDGRCEGTTNFQGFALAYTVPSAADADRVFAALADGGEVQMPLSETFFSSRFGMVADRFGVGWMVLVAQ
jgi:PhnB protein